ncbi:MAG: alpha-amylase [Desulfobulbaceae bacterium]|nr:MAG: alpha-amylase [Desulfobulbaceae bacterium]
MEPPARPLLAQISHYLTQIYPEPGPSCSIDSLCQEILAIMRLGDHSTAPTPHTNNWSEKDIVLITYGDSITQEGEKPLKVLKRFLDRYCQPVINSVHILPFFPFSSDDGFSIIDYDQVNPLLGGWRDIRSIAGDYRLMADLVINHCSAKSHWFRNFLRGEGVGHNYFKTVNENDDLRLVVRPRTSPLTRKIDTSNGEQILWCTFSHDQIDLNFHNPEVLLAFCKIIRHYLDKGVRLFRLDAIAFLWKESGTACINLPQTHLIVRLLRLLIEFAQHDAVLITETNIPVTENLSYFGELDEANWVYNFPLPPLLVHTLLTGSSSALKSWLMSMPPALNGTAYFNFIASHDGIGLRPVEGILSEDEMAQLAETTKRAGGKVSWRTVTGKKDSPYELNISLFDLLQGDIHGQDDLGEERFICAHVIMLGLEGIPGIYIHSLLGTPNDYERLQRTGENRSINRRQWTEERLNVLFSDPSSDQARIYRKMKGLLAIRTAQPAFHPNATQYTLQIRPEFFGVWRQSPDRKQSIFAISNISNEEQTLALATINLIDNQLWYDLLSGDTLNPAHPASHFEPYQSKWITNRL